MSNLIENIKQSFLEELEHLLTILPSLAIGALGFLVAWFLANRLKKLASRYLSKRMDDPLLANFIAKIIKVFILIGGGLFFLKQIGWGDAALGIMATAGLGAFVIGFALKDLGEHFLAGIIMAFQRPFRVGDTIEVTGIQGVIKGLSLRETHVKTFDGKDVYIPNGIILKNPLFNFTIDGFLRNDFVITLAHDAPVAQAIEIVQNVLAHTKGVLARPKSPTVTIAGIDLNGLQLKVLYWIDTTAPFSGTDIKKNLITQSVKALRENHFDLPKTGIDIHHIQ